MSGHAADPLAAGDDRSLMALRADCGFTYDARGRMLRTNEPCAVARRPAPRLFLGGTRPGVVVRYGATLPEQVVEALAEAIGRHAVAGDAAPPPALTAAVRSVLGRHAPVTAETAGLAYRFPTALPRPGDVVRLTVANRSLARDTFPWLHDEIADWQPCFAAVADGRAVSVCFSARLDAAAAEAGLETLPAHRRRGHGAAVTAAWAAAVRAAGRIPLYSTGWDNVASQGVARHLGLVQFGADATWA